MHPVVLHMSICLPTVGLADQVKICGYWNKRTADVTEGAS